MKKFIISILIGLIPILIIVGAIVLMVVNIEIFGIIFTSIVILLLAYGIGNDIVNNW